MINNRVVIEIDAELEEIIPAFLEKRGNEIPELRSLLLIGDFQKIKELGHKIKGNSGGYGFFKMGELGAQIELSASSQDSNKLKELIDELEFHFKNIQIKYI